MLIVVYPLGDFKTFSIIAEPQSAKPISAPARKHGYSPSLRLYQKGSLLIQSIWQQQQSAAALRRPESVTTAAIYARVSTADQKCDLQLTELRGYAQRSNWQIVEYHEKASGKAGGKRPQLDKLLADARLRKFDLVLVWKMDRFGRSLLHLIENVRTLDSLGIRFLVPSQSIDTDSKAPMGKFIMHIFGAFAEFERELLTERVRAGVAEAQRRGVHCGRPKKIFKRDRVLALFRSGLSRRAIARHLQVDEKTVRNLLQGAEKVSPRAA